MFVTFLYFPLLLFFFPSLLTLFFLRLNSFGFLFFSFLFFSPLSLCVVGSCSSSLVFACYSRIRFFFKKIFLFVLSRPFSVMYFFYPWRDILHVRMKRRGCLANLVLLAPSPEENSGNPNGAVLRPWCLSGSFNGRPGLDVTDRAAE